MTGFIGQLTSSMYSVFLVVGVWCEWCQKDLNKNRRCVCVSQTILCICSCECSSLDIQYVCSTVTLSLDNVCVCLCLHVCVCLHVFVCVGLIYMQSMGNCVWTCLLNNAWVFFQTYYLFNHELQYGSPHNHAHLGTAAVQSCSSCPGSVYLFPLHTARMECQGCCMLFVCLMSCNKAGFIAQI